MSSACFLNLAMRVSDFILLHLEAWRCGGVTVRCQVFYRMRLSWDVFWYAYTEIMYFGRKNIGVKCIFTTSDRSVYYPHDCPVNHLVEAFAKFLWCKAALPPALFPYCPLEESLTAQGTLTEWGVCSTSLQGRSCINCSEFSA